MQTGGGPADRPSAATGQEAGVLQTVPHRGAMQSDRAVLTQTRVGYEGSSRWSVFKWPWTLMQQEP